ncbi:MAG: hypothetical protein PUD02_03365 [Eggerthellales bacterium]|nr:hypothetical protein [Eggerthellales bacterium]
MADNACDISGAQPQASVDNPIETATPAIQQGPIEVIGPSAGVNPELQDTAATQVNPEVQGGAKASVPNTASPLAFIALICGVIGAFLSALVGVVGLVFAVIDMKRTRVNPVNVCALVFCLFDVAFLVFAFGMGSAGM